MDKLSKKEVETPWAVICHVHGQVFLDEDEYTEQLCRPNALWHCPTCDRTAQWDDWNYEKKMDERVVDEG